MRVCLRGATCAASMETAREDISSLARSRRAARIDCGPAIERNECSRLGDGLATASQCDGLLLHLQRRALVVRAVLNGRGYFNA